MTATLTRAVERRLFRRYRRAHDPRIEARLVASQLGLVAKDSRADGLFT